MEASALPRPAALPRPRLVVPAPVLRLHSDDQLVALFRAGSDDAFRAIHDRYRVRLLAYSAQMLGGSRADAEDALQDVFVRAHQALRANRQPIMLRAWLYRIAHNRCVDQLRRPPPVPSEIMPGAQLALSRGARHDPPTEAERNEDLRHLVADVHSLPEQQRSALLMRELQGLSYEELGCALGVSVAGVKSLLLRARGGVLDAAAARDTPCADIRLELASAHDRGVRASGRARRHMRECDQCSSYRGQLRSISRQVAALVPVGPLGHLGLLFGIGGGGAGAGAGAGAGGGGIAASGSSALLGGVATATATKVAAIVGACALVGGAGALQATAPPAHRQARARQATPRTTSVSPPNPGFVAHTAGGTIAPTPPTSRLGSAALPTAPTSLDGQAQLALASTAGSSPDRERRRADGLFDRGPRGHPAGRRGRAPRRPDEPSPRGPGRHRRPRRSRVLWVPPGHAGARRPGAVGQPGADLAGYARDPGRRAQWRCVTVRAFRDGTGRPARRTPPRRRPSRPPGPIPQASVASIQPADTSSRETGPPRSLSAIRTTGGTNSVSARHHLDPLAAQAAAVQLPPPGNPRLNRDVPVSLTH